MNTNRIAERFCDCTLPPAEWTHEAHLKVGLWHLLQYSPEDAMDHLRKRIRNYNIACGKENTDISGYHETITRFYVEIIAHFLIEQKPDQSVDCLAEILISKWGDQKLMFRYYSKEKLMSKEARRQWVEPDLSELLGSQRMRSPEVQGS
ncbi:MAG: hypothetical protein AAGD25_35465 [Cyanobacteria bacterium P01_F01_bin.150]